MYTPSWKTTRRFAELKHFQEFWLISQNKDWPHLKQLWKIYDFVKDISGSRPKNWTSSSNSTNLGYSKYQISWTILNFWTKFVKKGYFWSKKKIWTSLLNLTYLNYSKHEVLPEADNFHNFYSKAGQMKIVIEFSKFELI